MKFNQVKPGMYIRYKGPNVYCKVIAVRLWKRRGFKYRSIGGGAHDSGYKKLIFGKWSAPYILITKNRKVGLQCIKMYYGCPFKKLSREYGCKHATEPVKYYCLEAPRYAKDLEEVSKLKGMVKVGE